jgi:hypothetical protein
MFHWRTILPWRTILWAGTIAACLAVPYRNGVAGETAQKVSACQVLLARQWQALDQSNPAAANKFLGQARQDGCLQHPVAAQLCHIPAEQEARYDLNVNVTLVNRARNQQRLLGCPL